MTTYAEFERREVAQRSVMDRWYAAMGWPVDRSGAGVAYDLVLAGRTAEEKFRFREYPDILVELVQDVASANLGWFYTCSAERLVYVWCDASGPSHCWVLDLPAFKRWCCEHLSRRTGIAAVISNEGFGITMNVAFPKSEVPTGLYRKHDIADDLAAAQAAAIGPAAPRKTDRALGITDFF